MSRLRTTFLISLLCLAVVSTIRAQETLPPDHAARLARGQELFARQIRPLLLERCVRCHGGENVRSGLNLTTREGLVKGGDHGVVVTLWKGNASKLVKLVSHAADPHMPKEGMALNAEQVALLAKWIDDGAAYDKPLLDKSTPGKKPLVVTAGDREFWSFRPLQRPEPPAPKNVAWCRTPVDRFILAKLEEKKLTANSVG